MKIVSDSAICEGRSPKPDELGFSHYAQTICRVVEDNHEALTIGVYGRWGTGKTSLLRLIESELSARQNILPIWFNAWRYEREVHPLIPLLHRILTALEDSDNSAFRKLLPREGRRMTRTLRSVVSSLNLSLGLPSVSAMTPSLSLDGEILVRSLSRNRWRGMRCESLYVDVFRQLDQIHIPEECRVVVLVDDMDRCMPNNAVRLLEATKLAMSQPGIIFILGVSPRILLEHLEHQYSSEYGVDDFSGREYLEKIVQLPFYLPDNAPRMLEFTRSLLSSVPEETQADFEPILPLLATACRGVPRSAISFINSVLVARAMYQSLQSDLLITSEVVPVSAFATDRLLQLLWRDVYDVLTTSPEICSSIGQWQGDSQALHFSPPQAWGVVADKLGSDRLLCDFLSAETSREWLQREPWRRATSMFQVTSEELHLGSANEERQEFGLDGEFSPRVRRIAPVLAGEDVTLLQWGDPEAGAHALAQHLWTEGWGDFLEDRETEINFEGFSRAVSKAMPYLSGFAETLAENDTVDAGWAVFESLILQTLTLQSRQG